MNVTVSFFQSYDTHVTDLLHGTGESLEVKEYRVNGLTTRTVSLACDVIRCVNEAATRRGVANTRLNTSSSRSITRIFSFYRTTQGKYDIGNEITTEAELHPGGSCR